MAAARSPLCSKVWASRYCALMLLGSRFTASRRCTRAAWASPLSRRAMPRLRCAATLSGSSNKAFRKAPMAPDKSPFLANADPRLLYPRAYLGLWEMAFLNSATEIEEHTSELQSRFDLVCRLLLE